MSVPLRAFTVNAGLWGEPQNYGGSGGYQYSPRLEGIGRGLGDEVPVVFDSRTETLGGGLFSQGELKRIIAILENSGDSQGAQYYRDILRELERGALQSRALLRRAMLTKTALSKKQFFEFYLIDELDSSSFMQAARASEDEDAILFDEEREFHVTTMARQYLRQIERMVWKEAQYAWGHEIVNAYFLHGASNDQNVPSEEQLIEEAIERERKKYKWQQEVEKQRYIRKGLPVPDKYLQDPPPGPYETQMKGLEEDTVHKDLLNEIQNLIETDPAKAKELLKQLKSHGIRSFIKTGAVSKFVVIQFLSYAQTALHEQLIPALFFMDAVEKIAAGHVELSSGISVIKATATIIDNLINEHFRSKRKQLFEALYNTPSCWAKLHGMVAKILKDVVIPVKLSTVVLDSPQEFGHEFFDELFSGYSDDELPSLDPTGMLKETLPDLDTLADTSHASAESVLYLDPEDKQAVTARLKKIATGPQLGVGSIYAHSTKPSFSGWCAEALIELSSLAKTLGFEDVGDLPNSVIHEFASYVPLESLQIPMPENEAALSAALLQWTNGKPVYVENSKTLQEYTSTLTPIAAMHSLGSISQYVTEVVEKYSHIDVCSFSNNLALIDAIGSVFADSQIQLDANRHAQVHGIVISRLMLLLEQQFQNGEIPPLADAMTQAEDYAAIRKVLSSFQGNPFSATEWFSEAIEAIDKVISVDIEDLQGSQYFYLMFVQLAPPWLKTEVGNPGKLITYVDEAITDYMVESQGGTSEQDEDVKTRLMYAKKENTEKAIGLSLSDTEERLLQIESEHAGAPHHLDKTYQVSTETLKRVLKLIGLQPEITLEVMEVLRYPYHEARQRVQLEHGFMPTPYIRAITEMFYKLPWSGSFGGPKWGMIAEGTVKIKEAYPDDVDALALAIDNIHDLEHNTGSVFTKWRDVTYNYTDDAGNKLDKPVRVIKKGNPTQWIEQALTLKFDVHGTRDILARGYASPRIAKWVRDAYRFEGRSKELVPPKPPSKEEKLAQEVDKIYKQLEKKSVHAAIRESNDSEFYHALATYKPTHVYIEPYVKDAQNYLVKYFIRRKLKAPLLPATKALLDIEWLEVAPPRSIGQKPIQALLVQLTSEQRINCIKYISETFGYSADHATAVVLRTMSGPKLHDDDQDWAENAKLYAGYTYTTQDFNCAIKHDDVDAQVEAEKQVQTIEKQHIVEIEQKTEEHKETLKKEIKEIDESYSELGPPAVPSQEGKGELEPIEEEWESSLPKSSVWNELHGVTDYLSDQPSEFRVQVYDEASDLLSDHYSQWAMTGSELATVARCLHSVIFTLWEKGIDLDATSSKSILKHCLQWYHQTHNQPSPVLSKMKSGSEFKEFINAINMFLQNATTHTQEQQALGGELPEETKQSNARLIVEGIEDSIVPILKDVNTWPVSIHHAFQEEVKHGLEQIGMTFTEAQVHAIFNAMHKSIRAEVAEDAEDAVFYLTETVGELFSNVTSIPSHVAFEERVLQFINVVKNVYNEIVAINESEDFDLDDPEELAEETNPFTEVEQELIDLYFDYNLDEGPPKGTNGALQHIRSVWGGLTLSDMYQVVSRTKTQLEPLIFVGEAELIKVVSGYASGKYTAQLHSYVAPEVWSIQEKVKQSPSSQADINPQSMTLQFVRLILATLSQELTKAGYPKESSGWLADQGPKKPKSKPKQKQKQKPDKGGWGETGGWLNDNPALDASLLGLRHFSSQHTKAA